jgi:hypothetical protein
MAAEAATAEARVLRVLHPVQEAAALRDHQAAPIIQTVQPTRITLRLIPGKVNGILIVIYIYLLTKEL